MTLAKAPVGAELTDCALLVNVIPALVAVQLRWLKITIFPIAGGTVAGNRRALMTTSANSHRQHRNAAEIIQRSLHRIRALRAASWNSCAPL
jgi:hypothetical protein